MYGMQLSHVFEIAGISDEKLSISSEKHIILIENLGFRSKKPVFQIKKFEILGLSHIESKISSEILAISKT